jgi:hypothetical protein
MYSYHPIFYINLSFLIKKYSFFRYKLDFKKHFANPENPSIRTAGDRYLSGLEKLYCTHFSVSLVLIAFFHAHNSPVACSLVSFKYLIFIILPQHRHFILYFFCNIGKLFTCLTKRYIIHEKF